MAAAEPEALGVGIDLEDGGRFGHLGEAALRHAAERWLTADERAWCARQASLAEALVIVLSCKEAVFKACPWGRTVHDLALDELEGSAAGGRAVARQPSVRVEVRWTRWREQILTVAVALDADLAQGPAASLDRHGSGSFSTSTGASSPPSLRGSNGPICALAT